MTPASILGTWVSYGFVYLAQMEAGVIFHFHFFLETGVFAGLDRVPEFCLYALVGTVQPACVSISIQFNPNVGCRDCARREHTWCELANDTCYRSIGSIWVDNPEVRSLIDPIAAGIPPPDHAIGVGLEYHAVEIRIELALEFKAFGTRFLLACIPCAGAGLGPNDGLAGGARGAYATVKIPGRTRIQSPIRP